LYGSYFSALKTRQLTQIEGYFSVSGTSLFTWVVYEAATRLGTYNKVFEQTTSSSGTAKFHSSGAISVPLTTGKYYFIGVLLNGVHTYYYQSTYSLDSHPTSFGQYFGSYAAAATTPPATVPAPSSAYQYSYAQYYERVTTTKP
jgi:hypothetical protein